MRRVFTGKGEKGGKAFFPARACRQEWQGENQGFGNFDGHGGRRCVAEVFSTTVSGFLVRWLIGEPKGHNHGHWATEGSWMPMQRVAAHAGVVHKKRRVTHLKGVMHIIRGILCASSVVYPWQEACSWQ
ncbi:hypothetical protein AMTR_s00114p00084480 [Amborella trichopoda]|uniref:Uncharacterized protein n=1 Tax=Amborella trichopoda TaxID=13333 RepID=W1NPV1_AMBTC|nr:hypothetical protein AMTR_s00114p00084480 [Amborella trichopoda]